MDNLDVEKSSYGAFERFLYIFLIPIIFTLILAGVLLSLFDYNVTDTVLKAAHKIPFVGKLLPAVDSPQERTASAVQTAGSETDPDHSTAGLKSQLLKKEEELKKALADLQQKNESILELQAKNKLLEEQAKRKTQTEEQYDQQIRELASIYAKMTPSKAAPIMENLTLSEQALVLSHMKPDERMRVLEKMDPKKAAEASIVLKDMIPVDNLKIAALQERLQLIQQQNPGTAKKLSDADLGSTFANMTPKSAASVLLEMMSVSPNKVVGILSSMDAKARSNIMTALADLSKESAAAIANRLGN